MDEIECPDCGGNEAIDTGDGIWECEDCGFEWIEERL